MTSFEEHPQRQRFGNLKQIAKHILDLSSVFVNVSIAPKFNDDLATIPRIGSHVNIIICVPGEEGGNDAMLKSPISIKQ